MLKNLLVTLAAAVLIFAPMAEAANVNSNISTVTLNMTIGESVTESCTPGTITFTYDGTNTASASGPITCITTWNVAPTRTHLLVDSFLTSTTAALSDGTTNIPSSEIFMNMDGLGAAACTQSGDPNMSGDTGPMQCSQWFKDFPAGGGSTLLQNSANDTYVLSMSGLGILPAGAYTGTINFGAYAE